MKDRNSIFVAVVCLSILFAGVVNSALATNPEPAKTGHFKVLNTKECLSFLENEDGEQLSTHLLPQSYSRCLELTRKIKKHRVVEAENKVASGQDVADETDKARATNRRVMKNYYRVTSSKKDEEKGSE